MTATPVLSTLRRWAFLAYGLIAYAVFLGTVLYAVGFVGNLVVPASLDRPVRGDAGPAIVVDALLLALFAVQHSGMARQGFKRAWTRVVPREIERSTYVLATSGCLLLLFWLWQPIGPVLWDVSGTPAAVVLLVVAAVGWLIVVISTFLIDHGELFGLRQVIDQFRGAAPRAGGFATPGLYRVVRHPLYVGFVIAFWATPVMTAGHLVFAVATTAYILVAIQLEERDLIAAYGDRYRRYRAKVRMLIPLPRRGNAR